MNQDHIDRNEQQQTEALDNWLSQVGAQPVPVDTESARREAMRQIRREALPLKRHPVSWHSVVAAAAAVVLGFGFWWLFRSTDLAEHQGTGAVVQSTTPSAPRTVVVVNMPPQVELHSPAARESEPTIIVAIGPALAETADDDDVMGLF